MFRPSFSIFLLLSAFAACAVGLRRGQWRQLSKKGSLLKLARSKWSFNPQDNLRHCKKRTSWVWVDGRKDYTKLINSKMAQLYKLGGGTLRLGAGMSRTTLKLRNYSPRFKLSGNIRSFETERVSIIGLTVNGNRYRQKKGKSANYGRYGLFTELTNYLLIRDVRVTLNAQYGFDPHGSKKYWAYYLIVDSCRADRNGLDGFTIDQTVHAVVAKCIAVGNDRHGFNVVTGTRYAIFRDNLASNNGKGSRVGHGYVAQNNQNFGTRYLTFQRCMSKDDWKGGIKLRDVRNVYVEDCSFVNTGKGSCYELAKTRSVFLRRNRCAVRASRKFKLTGGAKYVEVGDRSKLRKSPAFVRRKPRMPKSSPVGSDPRCRRGIWNRNVCCDKGCAKCGVAGCGSKANGPGGKYCCAGAIRRAAKPCSMSGPPCVMSSYRK